MNALEFLITAACFWLLSAVLVGKVDPEIVAKLIGGWL